MAENENVNGLVEGEIDEMIEELAEHDDERYSRELDAKIDGIKEKFVSIGEGAVPRLIDLLNGDGFWSSVCAAEALGEIGDKRAIPALAGRLEDEGLAEKAYEALKKFGPESVPEVIKKVEYRISNPVDEEKGPPTLTMYALTTIGEVRCEESATFLVELLDDYISEMPDEEFNPRERDWKYRNVDFFQLLDSLVKQGDKGAIPHIRRARDSFPENYTDYKVCQIAMGRIKKGETDGYLPLEALDIMAPPGAIMDALTGGEIGWEDDFDEEYGEYFEDESEEESE